MHPNTNLSIMTAQSGLNPLIISGNFILPAKNIDSVAPICAIGRFCPELQKSADFISRELSVMRRSPAAWPPR
jgi:hypothetical protein